MIAFLIAFATETARILYEGSFYILLGFLIAGLLQEFLPGGTIARHLGSESPRSVLRGALLGLAMPLCSCGVVPAAAALRRKGASRSAITSFLISTPETGEEAVALTYGLLGPVMAIVRPIVAIVTAVVAGMLVLLVGEEAPAANVAQAADEHGHDHVHGLDDDVAQAPRSWRERIGSVGAYGFRTLVDDLAFWLLFGILLTGLLSALLPNDFFSRVLGWDRGLVPMLAMMLVGVPLYLCASASTPVAAGLIAKGLSPGAALVFLLTGPATNVATIALVGQMLGRRVLRVYLGTIAGVSIAAGLLLDAFAADRVRAAVVQAVTTPDGGFVALVKIAAAFVFLALAAASFHRTRFREGRRDLVKQFRDIGALVRGFRVAHLTRPPVLAALAIAAPRIRRLARGADRRSRRARRGAALRPCRRERSRTGPASALAGADQHGFTVDTDGARQLSVGFVGSAAGDRSPVGDESFFLTADENRRRPALRRAVAGLGSGPLRTGPGRRRRTAARAGAPVAGGRRDEPLASTRCTPTAVSRSSSSYRDALIARSRRSISASWCSTRGCSTCTHPPACTTPSATSRAPSKIARPKCTTPTATPPSVTPRARANRWSPPRRRAPKRIAWRAWPRAPRARSPASRRCTTRPRVSPNGVSGWKR